MIGEEVIEDEYSVVELLEILAELIPKEKHYDTLDHFTHYVLQIAGTLQSWGITWFAQDEEELIHNPLTVFNENCLWTELKTHEDTDHVKIFAHVYDIFTNEFMIEKKSPKLEMIFPDYVM